jgi:xylulose-5-phosphate/fructose-6-phosphate phosphoketolase
MTPTSTDVQPKGGDGTKGATAGSLPAEDLRKMDAYWRASNYLSVGQIYLLGNPLLKEPLKLTFRRSRADYLRISEAQLGQLS